MNGKKAVVCDDDRTMTRIVSHVLGKLGFTVLAAENGEEGLSLVRTEKPALLILDLDMPVKDGLGLLQDLWEEASRPYIIVLSAHEGADKHEQVKLLGAQDVMVKPFIAADFLKKVEGLLAEGKV